MIRVMKTSIMIFCALFFLSACAAKRPVLYPNSYFKQVGEEGAEADIDECMRLATEHGADSDKTEEIAKDTAGSAAVGAAAGAAVGAVFGSAGKGAAAGAAGGGVSAAGGGILRSGEPDPVFRGFVDKCLLDKGYEPIGWR